MQCVRGIREGSFPRSSGAANTSCLGVVGVELAAASIGTIGPWLGPYFIDGRSDVGDVLCGWRTGAGLVASVMGSAVDVWWLLGYVRFPPVSSSLPVCWSGRTLVFMCNCSRVITLAVACLVMNMQIATNEHSQGPCSRQAPKVNGHNTTQERLRKQKRRGTMWLRRFY